MAADKSFWTEPLETAVWRDVQGSDASLAAERSLVLACGGVDAALVVPGWTGWHPLMETFRTGFAAVSCRWRRAGRDPPMAHRSGAVTGFGGSLCSRS
jgi:hypothetical protein